MNTNTRFSVAVQMLTLIAFKRDGYVNSDLLALSVNTNPVVVRRLVGQLKKAGLVTVRAGVGGTGLSRPAGEISLRDVYLAVKQESKSKLVNLHPNPNAKCFVGRSIHAALAEPLSRAEQEFQDSLAKTSIADIKAFIRARKPVAGAAVYLA